jgi:phosphinothricin acetyltransferase
VFKRQKLSEIGLSMETISFHPVTDEFLRVLVDILNYYIEHTTVSFHTERLSPDEMREKVYFGHSAFQAFVIKQESKIVGYCAVSPWKQQQAYRSTGEINIYLSHDHTGKGIGSKAINHLIEHAKANDIQNLIAGLCSENYPSRRLFEKNGFELCAHFKRVGRKFERLLDTIYLQKQLAD